MEHKDDGAEVVDLDVFYGERYEFQVGLANVGNFTVEELELRSATIQFCPVLSLISRHLPDNSQ